MIKRNKCPICNAVWSKNNSKTTKLRGVFSLERKMITEWLCPKCKTRWSEETGEVTGKGKNNGK